MNADRRDVALDRAFAGEQPTRRLVPVCPYCPDAFEQTAAARAHGYEVTSTTCDVHVAALTAQLEALEASR